MGEDDKENGWETRPHLSNREVERQLQEERRKAAEAERLREAAERERRERERRERDES